MLLRRGPVARDGILCRSICASIKPERSMTYRTPLTLSGPLRAPRQMLAEQEYGGHASIHDDAKAAELGFVAGPIEGPTHFSQFVPLLARIWGADWFERGCFSAHFLNMVVEGEEVRAFVDWPEDGATRTRAWAEKADGTPVLEARATLGDAPTLLDERMAALRAPGPLVILGDLRVGMTLPPQPVRMAADQHMGPLYPFSLTEKLAKITEGSDWHVGASPWGGPIIPLEMVSVLAEYTGHDAGFPVRGPVVGLYADLEVRMMRGPLMVGHPYQVRREVVALAESRRTESYWVRTRIFNETGTTQIAETLLNHATLKQSLTGYDEKRALLEETP
jgi:hypothetical protein